MKELKIEKQKNPTGCGISCVASIKNLTYTKAKILMIRLGIFERNSRTFYTEKSDLRKVLGIKQRFHNIKSWKRLEKFKELIAIVGINRRKFDKNWHWVVYQKIFGKNPFVLDPHHNRKKRKRNISNQMRPWTYIRIK